LFGGYWVLWYSISNTYSVVESSFKNLLDYYLQSETIDSFKANLQPRANAETLLETIDNYLNDCNKTPTPTLNNHTVFDASNRCILKHYIIKGKSIRVNFDSELVLKTIHPALAHLSTELSNNIHTTFDIYLKNESLLLFKDEQLISCVPKRDYHLMQGKFIMQLLCTIHDNEEEDWVSTFHGSTLTDSISSVLFVGESGKGKSTLCALLTANGFDLLADDVSPMLSKNSCIYHNPSAISIKEGAFNLLEPIINTFSDLPIIKFNKTKGPLKYIACTNPKKNFYPCKAIVLVNYKSNADTKLESVSIKTLLETLIPDSWLSPNPLHAKQFLEWLESLDIFKLTYSDTKSVTNAVSKLFKQLNKNL